MLNSALIIPYSSMWQAMFVGLIPGVGSVLSLFHMAMLYALYSFEYKWMYMGEFAANTVRFTTVNGSPP